MITINYGEAKIKLKPLLLNELFKYQLESAELLEQAYDKEGKILSTVALVKFNELKYKNFVDSLVSVENLTDVDGTEVSLQDLKELRVQGNLLNALIKAHTQAINLELASEEIEPKKD